MITKGRLREFALYSIIDIATLSLMNTVKTQLVVPYNMQLCNITTIYKSKGSRLDMSSDRGIFILPVLRKILDKLTYIDKYPELDLSMSDSNIGARKNKNIRNHLFIIHGVINSVVQDKDRCVDIQVYDLEQDRMYSVQKQDIHNYYYCLNCSD